jgi:hypothetical protein
LVKNYSPTASSISYLNIDYLRDIEKLLETTKQIPSFVSLASENWNSVLESSKSSHKKIGKIGKSQM